jgi:hypothetical protein
MNPKNLRKMEPQDRKEGLSYPNPSWSFLGFMIFGTKVDMLYI